MPEQTEFTCEVKSVFSGDDLVVLVDLGIEDLWKRRRVRLKGVDTPDAVRQSANTEAGRIRDEVRLLVKNKRGKLQVIDKNSASWVVVLTVDTPAGPVNVNDYLIQKGYRFQPNKA